MYVGIYVYMSSHSNSVYTCAVICVYMYVCVVGRMEVDSPFLICSRHVCIHRFIYVNRRHIHSSMRRGPSLPYLSTYIFFSLVEEDGEVRRWRYLNGMHVC